VIAFEALVQQAIAGVPAAKHAPVPRLVKQDKSFKPFVEMRRALEHGEWNNAWIAYEELKSHEPDCGRAALLAVEVFRSLAAQSGDVEQVEKFRRKSMEAGIEGLKFSPNDVMLRGTLCWNAYILHARKEWALAGLKQALSIQPLDPQLLEWHAMIENYFNADRTVQASWINQQVQGKLKDGRTELAIGDLYFNAGQFAEGVKWYLKGIEYAPDSYDLHFAIGLCATYEAERLLKVDLPGAAGAAVRDQAVEMYELASNHMWRSIQLDPLELDYAYDFYLRSVTHSYTRLPTALDELDNMFLVWAARDGLASTTRTGKLDNVVSTLIKQQRLDSRAAARSASPQDEDFAMQLMARLHFSVNDNKPEETIRTLWMMKEHGLRPDVYTGYMKTFAPLVEKFEAK
jgi:tetratricopeptide (TPR) repeat protein